TFGLTHDLDLPSFLRFSGMQRSERLRAFRDWLLALPDKVVRWILARPALTDVVPHETVAYARLMLAFGLARLGDERAARQQAAQARERLDQWSEPEADVPHVLLEAFGYRLEQALRGQPAAGPLPAEILEYLPHIERDPRFKIERMRMESRILEPHEAV